MDLFQTIQHVVGAAGGSIESLPANRWDKVSINGHKTATVTSHGVGLKDESPGRSSRSRTMGRAPCIRSGARRTR